MLCNWILQNPALTYRFMFGDTAILRSNCIIASCCMHAEINENYSKHLSIH